MSIRVVAEFHLRAEAVDAFLAAAEELVAATHANDDGCVAYDLYRDSADALHLTVIEEWRDQPSLDAHMAKEHFQRLLPRLDGAADPARPAVITVYEPVV